jgi:hypothetical protein
MGREIRTKKSFGSFRIARYSPKLPEGLPKALNVHISFEEAMRLHLGIGQALAKLNGYDRSTRAGRRSALNLCIFLQKQRITINEGEVSIAKNSSEGDAEPSPSPDA